MDAYMVVATFKADTVMDEVFAVVAEEQARIRALAAKGRVGPLHISLARGTIFIEVFADDLPGAEATVRTLPMSKWWDLDVYPLSPPVVPEGAA